MKMKTITTIALLAVLLSAMLNAWTLAEYYQSAQEQHFDIDTLGLVRWGLKIVCELGLASFFFFLRRNQE